MWTFILIVVVILVIATFIDKKEKRGDFKVDSKVSKKNKSVQREWEQFTGSEQMPGNFQYILRQFFVPDQIDPQKFTNNLKANEAINLGIGLEMMEAINSDSINCTPTFRKHFANESLNRGLQAPDWFFVAYPDVAYWLINNMTLFEELTNGREHEFINEGKIKDTLFREMINYYKANVNKNLECSF